MARGACSALAFLSGGGRFSFLLSTFSFFSFLFLFFLNLLLFSLAACLLVLAVLLVFAWPENAQGNALLWPFEAESSLTHWKDVSFGRLKKIAEASDTILSFV